MNDRFIRLSLIAIIAVLGILLCLKNGRQEPAQMAATDGYVYVLRDGKLSRYTTLYDISTGEHGLRLLDSVNVK